MSIFYVKEAILLTHDLVSFKYYDFTIDISSLPKRFFILNIAVSSFVVGDSVVSDSFEQEENTKIIKK